MSGLRTDARSIVNTITQLLRDRYASGYPILKELLQNADDAQACRFRADFRRALPGAGNAANPLLKVPGVLLLNDGNFSDQDMAGMLNWADSAKAADNTQAGKFGIGQKAVFHLCDAFVVFSQGHGVAPDVVNPFVDVELPTKNAAKSWELSPEDKRFLRAYPGPRSWDRYLAIWIPFRSPTLRPAPDVGFSSTMPSVNDVLDAWKAPDDICTALTLLRHLAEVTICVQGEPVVDLRVTGNARRLLPPQARAPEASTGIGSPRAVRGRIIERSPDGPRPRRFVGSQVYDPAPEGELRELKQSPHWPRTSTAFHPVPQPEKGEAHGAVTLWRRPRAAESRLVISWAVFLPVAREEDVVITVASPGSSREDAPGDVRVLMHGYFFLDSGRKRIDGVARRPVHSTQVPSAPAAAGDEAMLRRAWNDNLCKSVVLPLLPSVLRDSLQRRVLDGRHLHAVVKSIAEDDWFQRWRSSICRTHALVRVLNLPEPAASVSRAKPRWSIEDAARAHAFRPLPDVGTAPASALAAVFPGIRALAARRDIVLCVTPAASLTAENMEWPIDDLETLFRSLSPKAFQLPGLARFLGKFLSEHVASRRDAPRQAAPRIVGALRQAMIAGASLADDNIQAILRHLRTSRLCVLPKDLKRSMLRVLASADTDVLPVRSTWLPDGFELSTVAPAEVAVLVQAAAKELDGPQADAAGRTISSLIESTNGVGELARLLGPISSPVFRAEEVRERQSAPLSLRDLMDLARNGLLFQDSPPARMMLPLAVAALRDVSPFIASEPAAKLLRAFGDEAVAARNPDGRALGRLVNLATDFGDADERHTFLKKLLDLQGDVDAMRCLCAGQRVSRDVALWYLPREVGDLDAIVRRVHAADQYGILLSHQINRKLNDDQRGDLAIKPLVMPSYVRRISERSALRDALESCDLSNADRARFFQIPNVDNAVLAKLPIFGQKNGKAGGAHRVFRVTDQWPVPSALQDHVRELDPCEDSDARRRQEEIVDEWSPRAQIETALETSAPHEYRMAILDAIACLGDGEWTDLLCGELRNRSWLVVGTEPVRPGSVLHVPDDVAREWRALARDHGLGRLIATCDFPSDVSGHRAFGRLLGDVVPSIRESLHRLVTAVRPASIAARLQSGTDYPLEALVRLAAIGADLGLSGWPLLASLLRSEDELPHQYHMIECFGCVDSSEPAPAVAYLNALAGIASEKTTGAAEAHDAYRRGFAAVATWPLSVQRNVFRDTKVPTEAGEWKYGREVATVRQGLDPRYVLEDQCAEVLSVEHRRLAGKDVGGKSDADGSPGGWWKYLRGSEGRRQVVHLTPSQWDRLRVEADDSHAAFLKDWQGLIPRRLAVVYLALFGKRASLYQLAADWQLAEHQITASWNEVRTELWFGNVELALNIRRHRRQGVSAVSLSGEELAVPPDRAVDEWLRGDAHEIPIRHVASGRPDLYVFSLQIHEQDIVARRAATDPVTSFRDFVEAMVGACFPLWDRSQNATLDRLLDKAANVRQTTLAETIVLLRDRMPSTLDAIKPPRQSVVGKALRVFREGESRAVRHGHSYEKEINELKLQLWRKVGTSAAFAQLLDAVRNRIDEYGYSAKRVLFELFQNADDAYCQIAGDERTCTFRLRLQSAERDGFQVVHWGRPVNHPGEDAEAGHKRGYGRDLLNMLLMNLSEKRSGEEVTGRFGLGFKSVHLIADDVGIASHRIALRIHGGLIPEDWPNGVMVADRERGAGPPATVIDVPCAEECETLIQQAVAQFRSLLSWLPLFARRIRRIEVYDADRMDDVVEVKKDEEIADGVRSVIVGGKAHVQVLVFDLNDGFRLVLGLDTAGPTMLPSDVPGLWNVAPLGGRWSRGCLLGGPFDVDPGRARLSGSDEGRRSATMRRGRYYGYRLMSLYEAATRDWSACAKMLHLDDSERGRERFWRRLFEVVGEDLGDGSLARHLHGTDRGYGMLAAKEPVVPTGLPRPCSPLVRADSVRYRTAGALESNHVRQVVLARPEMMSLARTTIASTVADQLKKLGFGPFESLSVLTALRLEMGDQLWVEPQLAAVLGKALSAGAITPASFRVNRDIQEVADEALFLCKDGEWRSAREVWVPETDDKHLSGFAPKDAVLHADYCKWGMKLVEVAKGVSVHAPDIEIIRRWALAASDLERQRAVLKYLLRGKQGRELFVKLADHSPAWFPDGQEPFPEALLADWPDEDKTFLDRLLGRSRREIGETEISADSESYPATYARLVKLGPPTGPRVEEDQFTGKPGKWMRRTTDTEPRPSERDKIERVGVHGEIHAFLFLKARFGIDESAWVSKFRTKVIPLREGEEDRTGDHHGYDFKFDHGGKTWHVEVKATAGNDVDGFKSDNQDSTARRIAGLKDQHWRILRVRQALSDQPQFDWLPNPRRWRRGGTREAAAPVLREVHAWWMRSRTEMGTSYGNRIYPAPFIDRLSDWDDSHVSWFTMFALACFQAMGRVQDRQTREFVDAAWKNGWWQELVLGDDARLKAVTDRLQEWSQFGLTSQQYVPWRRRLVDLHAIARGIKGYSRFMRKLPQIVRNNRRTRLSSLLRPAQSNVHRILGTEAPPIDVSLGLGMNWMIRELIRIGAWSESAKRTLAPYCWAPRKGVRTFLNHLGAELGDKADMDASRRLWDFVSEVLGEQDASFNGDFDLPIQLLTLKEQRTVREDIFRQANVVPPPDFTEATR